MTISNHLQFPRGMPIQPPKGPRPSANQQRKQKPGGEFRDLLAQELQRSPLKFSAHAEKRLKASGISLSPQQLTALEDAVNKVEQKGGKESLVVLDDMALLVSVKNRTVITAIESSRLRENVFTNIDSAVIT